MKRILTLTTAILLIVSAQAQDLKKILGTWEIKSFKYGYHPNNNEYHTRFKKYKSYTPTHFIVIEIDARTNVTTTSIFGNYEIKDGIYTESILNVNRESAGMMGQKFSFTLNFDGNDKMYSTGSFNGMKSSELWERVSKSNLEQLLQGGKQTETSKTAIITMPAGVDSTATKPLYVLKGAGKTAILKKTHGGESPLSLIPQGDIATIEVLKNSTAVELYKEPGRYGVIIIGLKDEKMEEVLESLKSKGIEMDSI